MSLLVLGKTGQLARAFRDAFGNNAYYASRDEADFTNLNMLKELIERVKPSVIINAVAYTQVDKAQEEEALAFAVNADAVGYIAKLAKERGITFVHFSTDYVFDGKGNAPHLETEQCAPLNVYGKSKRAGEEAILTTGGNYLILRTSWVFDATGKNFLTTMLRLAKERETLSIVSDQIGAPSYAPHLAKVTTEILAHKHFSSGIYHLCNSGETSWYGFADEIFAQARKSGLPLKVKEVLPISSQNYPTPAMRPLNSRLNCEKLQQVFGITLPTWQNGVQTAIALQ